jgi:hypothetical protein
MSLLKSANDKLQYPNIFLCEKCQYITTYKSNYNKHLKSKKHSSVKKIKPRNVQQRTPTLKGVPAVEILSRLKVLKDASSNIIENMQNMLREEILLSKGRVSVK